MPSNDLLGFADEYARFKNDLEGVHGNIGRLSQRGLVNALLAIFRELQTHPDPIAAISEAIFAYRHWEQEEAREYREHLAAEERQQAEWIAAETRARMIGCPSCGAGPGDVCHRPNGRPAQESHRRRYRAARQLADAAVLEPAP